MFLNGIYKLLKATFWLVCWSICPSVRPSVTKLFIGCFTQFKDILKVFECFYVIHTPLLSQFLVADTRLHLAVSVSTSVGR